ncbi:MAG TPA: hypothetical protein VJB58_00850 [Candidatus Paceibacterota bacterium]
MKLGVILRCFAKTPELVKDQVIQIHKTVGALTATRRTGVPISRIDVVIPINPAFIDVDCGKTKNTLGKLPTHLVSTVRETRLDIFSGAVNETAIWQLSRGCTHTLVLSSSCASLVSEENLEALIEPFEDSALVAGFVLPDPTLSEFIKRGCITNTFAIWDLVAFFSVGGMSLAEGNPRVDRSKNRYIQTEDGPIAFAGLETTTLYRLGVNFGRCIAPVFPLETGVWETPDPAKDPEGSRREHLKRKSKTGRHEACLQMEGYDWREMENFILPGYPK